MWTKSSYLTLLVGMKMVLPLGKTVWHFLKVFNIEFPHDPAILPLSMHLGEMKAHVHTKACKQMIMEGGGIHNGQKVETTQMSFNQ